MLEKVFGTAALMMILAGGLLSGAEVSDETAECLDCHRSVTPGIVADWENSAHARISPSEAADVSGYAVKVNSEVNDLSAMGSSVGCYECHSLNADAHKDAFDHMGYTISIVPGPRDCAVCHQKESEEYGQNRMSHAYSNLMDNDLYRDLMLHINGDVTFEDGSLHYGPANNDTESESCLYCHGTEVGVAGMEYRETDMGEFEFPVLTNWPNQGVGRINPDGSLGSCTSCHPRHSFSLAVARSPYTCAECHKGPDVPAFKIYEASKHGNIYKAEGKNFDMHAVPWVPGRDFNSPTCAACHVSLLTTEDGDVIAERTHAFSDRLGYRLFGVPYAHNHPAAPSNNGVINSAGLPLMTELDGSPVSSLLITDAERERRHGTMKTICCACHSSQWTDSHFRRLDNSVRTSNAATLTGTQMLTEAWTEGFIGGLPQGESIFDDAFEQDWVTLWLFYANSVRLSSAMGGGGDYGVFADGRYQLTGQLRDMEEWLEQRKMMTHKKRFRLFSR